MDHTHFWWVYRRVYICDCDCDQNSYAHDVLSSYLQYHFIDVVSHYVNKGTFNKYWLITDAPTNNDTHPIIEYHLQTNAFYDSKHTKDYNENNGTNNTSTSKWYNGKCTDHIHTYHLMLHYALQTSPWALVYGRDMIVNVPVISDLIAIRKQRQQLVDNNQKWYDYYYKVGDEVMIRTYNPTKLQEWLHKSYQITKCRTNGIVSIERRAAERLV